MNLFKWRVIPITLKATLTHNSLFYVNEKPKIYLLSPIMVCFPKSYDCDSLQAFIKTQTRCYGDFGYIFIQHHSAQDCRKLPSLPVSEAFVKNSFFLHSRKGCHLDGSVILWEHKSVNCDIKLLNSLFHQVNPCICVLLTE